MPKYNIEAAIVHRYQFHGPDHAIEADDEDEAREIAIARMKAQYAVTFGTRNSPPPDTEIIHCEQMND